MLDIVAQEIRVCAHCIGEPFLHAHIEKTGTRGTCHYCEKTHACFTLEEVCDVTEQAVNSHFFRTPDEPSDREYAMIKHCDHEWYRSGEPINEVIGCLLEADASLAGDIQQILEDKYSHSRYDEAWLETDFASDSCYALCGKVSTERLDSMWATFVTSLKQEARYINNTVKATLDGIFRGLDTLKTGGDRTVITEGGPGSDIAHLYRARWSRNHNELEQFITIPDRELGPPPHQFSGANRMSPRGISVFYGASSVDTAISEIRPPVGCHVVSAKFNIIRPLRLLNLLALEDILDTGSMLDPEYIVRREQAAFLKTLTSWIVKPVLPGEEDFSYIPTQVIAEYLAESEQLNLDGILYPSVQLDGSLTGENYNVVLFRKASRVNLMALPALKDCLINFVRQYDEDDWETDICVTEMVDTADIPSPQDMVWDVLPPETRDRREPSLEIDLPSVGVHRIKAARFEYSTDMVSRNKHVFHSPPPSDYSPWDFGALPDDVPF
ncbi:RES domain-containing protein [Pectobacterium versatile]|uniref:RES domain-containing protein n=1 Tax=Pectobacterium versatile TaxID=2488639 RepID=UPI0030175DC4